MILIILATGLLLFRIEAAPLNHVNVRLYIGLSWLFLENWYGCRVYSTMLPIGKTL